jgi:hypothetical protein
MLHERKKLLRQLAGGNGELLVVERKIPDFLWYRLSSYVAEYISFCLHDFDTFEVVNLPNRTHNGKLEPKREHLEIFNDIESEAGKIIRYLTPDAHSVRLPVNIRVKTGEMSAEDARNYATSKPHTDVWAGDPANTAVIIIPLLGDIEKQGLKFGEPVGIAPGFEEQHDTYESGMQTIAGVRWYNMPMRSGYAYVVDSYCIHCTQMRGGSRVSIDTRVSYDTPQDARYAHLYHPIADTENGKFLTDADTIAQTLEKYGKTA